MDLSGLTDLLIRQARHVGSVVKVRNERYRERDTKRERGSWIVHNIQVVSEKGDSEDSSSDEEERDGEGDEVYGVTSAINLTYHKVRFQKCYNLSSHSCHLHDVYIGRELCEATA